MSITMPFLTAYDPLGASEGTLDPLGLYQIADQLAVLLVPAVRERMQRVRFLTAMAVGALVTEDIDEEPDQRDASPSLVWEWLVVEALCRREGEHPADWGVPGTLVTKQAIGRTGYLDARSYLKTPRIFGFHGVYKRLAVHLGIMDVHLRAGPHAEDLVEAWARGVGFAGLEAARPLLKSWTDAVRRSLRERPPRAKPGFDSSAWQTLADAFAPSGAGARERRFLRERLLEAGDGHLGALRDLWSLQESFPDAQYREELLHVQLARRAPVYRPLLAAIQAYEGFARGLHDGFDLLKAEASLRDAHGYAVPEIAKDAEFRKSVAQIHDRFLAAQERLKSLPGEGGLLANLLAERFGAFAEPMEPAACALAMCSLHEAVQKGKSLEGKRPWFDRLGADHILIRQSYREARRPCEPDRYVHPYRGGPIRRFYKDVS